MMNIALYITLAAIAVWLVVDLYYRIIWWRAQRRAHWLLHRATDLQLADYIRKQGGELTQSGREDARRLAQALERLRP